jgi:cyanobactin maturation PatA/PatG family protease
MKFKQIQSGRWPALNSGDARVVIAILDGPVDLTHPALHGAKLVQLQSVTPVAASGGRASAHGTHVASIIFSQPGTGIDGAAPRCTGLLIPIFSDEHDGAQLACSQLDLARAILLAVENGAHIINISGGQLARTAEPEPVLAQAIESCARHNVLIVAAAGNDGCECLHVPAAVGTVLAVGAMDDEGRPLASSNWGAEYQAQGILAPGLDIAGAAIGGGIVRRSGTSFAAPYVSGVAAQLIAFQLAQGRLPDPHAVRAALLAGASPCSAGAGDDCRKVLSGRINIHQAVQHLAGGVNQMSETATLVPTSIMPSESIAPSSDVAIMPSPAVAQIALASSRMALDRNILMSAEGGLDEVIRPSADEVARQPSQLQLLQVPVESRGQITPSCGCGGDKPGGCGCGGGEKCSCGGHGGAVQKPQLVYAIGRIGYDFGTEARRDSFIQAMGVGGNNPYAVDQLLSYLVSAPYEAPSLIWTLNLDATPIYAIQPLGAFAAAGYERLREFVDGQLNHGVELVSIPGVIGGSVRLQSGQVVPVIVPALRGMFAWATRPLVEHALGVRPENAERQATFDRNAGGLTDFLDRVYYDLRNLGITAEERALNYSATNAVQVAEVIRATTSESLDLDTLHVKRSPVCRPDSECYDVELAFFNPNNTNIARRIFRFTVDVSDIIPVSIGETRSWTRR